MVILLNSVGETDEIESSLTSDIVSLLVSDSFEVFFASKESKKKEDNIVTFIQLLKIWEEKFHLKNYHQKI